MATLYTPYSHLTWSNLLQGPEQKELLTCIGSMICSQIGKNLAFTVYWLSLKVHYVIVQGLEKHNSLHKPCSFLWDLSLGQSYANPLWTGALEQACFDARLRCFYAQIPLIRALLLCFSDCRKAANSQHQQANWPRTQWLYLWEKYSMIKPRFKLVWFRVYEVQKALSWEYRHDEVHRMENNSGLTSILDLVLT